VTAWKSNPTSVRGILQSLADLATDMSEAAEELVYLYCVTQNEPTLKDLADVAGSLYCVCNRGLYAVAGKVGTGEFGEQSLRKNLANLEWVKTKANAHESIIEAVMSNACVIPFKFGTLFNTDDSLKAMLVEYADEFKAILHRLQDKEEWGVKIYCNIDTLKSSVAGEDEGVLRIENEINSSTPGKAYFLNKKKAELIGDAINKRLSEYGQESFARLRRLSFAARINKLLPREVTDRSDDMVLNSAFLVDKDQVANFVDMVDDIRMRYQDKGLFVDCTGPWPPYNFCSLSKETVQNG
jgi:hypothetical protein